MSTTSNNCTKCQSTIVRTSGTHMRNSEFCDKCYDLKYIRICTVCDSTYNVKTNYTNRKWNYSNGQKTTLITDNEKETKCHMCHSLKLIHAICLYCSKIYGHYNIPGGDKTCNNCAGYFVLGQGKRIQPGTHKDYVLEFYYNVAPRANYPFYECVLYAPIYKLQHSQIIDDMKNNPLNYFDPKLYGCSVIKTSFGTKYWSFKNLEFKDLKIVPYP